MGHFHHLVVLLVAALAAQQLWKVLTSLSRLAVLICLCLAIVLLVVVVLSRLAWLKQLARLAWEEIQTVDETTLEDASGLAVVDATVDRIEQSEIFGDDGLLLRRIAYVETTNGNDMSDGCGGVWQIGRHLFQEIKKTFHNGDKIAKIKLKLDIDLKSVNHSDMRKPLHCALFARLWIDIQIGTSSNVPRSADEQAQFWADKYHHPANSVSPSRFTDKMSATQSGDIQVPRADILFVLDGSRSITDEEFGIMKQFVKNLVEASTVGADHVRFGLTLFADSVDLEFDIGKHPDNKGVCRAIDDVEHPKGVSTNTGLALKNAKDMFQRNGRHKAGIPQICIFATDGTSSNKARTIKAAKELHDAPIGLLTVFAIGVPKLQEVEEIRTTIKEELEAIGTEPSNTHVFQLASFDEMKHFRDLLAKRLSSAPAKLALDDKVSGTIKSDSYSYYKLEANGDCDSVTIQVQMKYGGTKLFLSFGVHNPSSATHDYMVDCSKASGKTWSVRIPKHLMKGKNLFMALLGTDKENTYSLVYSEESKCWNTLVDILLRVSQIPYWLFTKIKPWIW